MAPLAMYCQISHVGMWALCPSSRHRTRMREALLKTPSQSDSSSHRRPRTILCGNPLVLLHCLTVQCSTMRESGRSPRSSLETSDKVRDVCIASMSDIPYVMASLPLLSNCSPAANWMRSARPVHRRDDTKRKGGETAETRKGGRVWTA